MVSIRSTQGEHSKKLTTVLVSSINFAMKNHASFKYTGIVPTKSLYSFVGKPA